MQKTSEAGRGCGMIKEPGGMNVINFIGNEHNELKRASDCRKLVKLGDDAE